MRSFLFLLLLGVSCGMRAQEAMSPAEAEGLKAQVGQTARETRSMACDFTQYRHLDFLSNDIISSGKLYFKMPDQVKWQYTTPFRYAVLFKGGMLYIDDEGRKSEIDIGSSALFSQLNHLVSGSIRGDMFDADAFTMEFYKKEHGGEVYFMPKDADLAGYIQRFQLTFNGQGEVTEVRMVEPSGDYTRIVLSGRSVNQNLADAVFAP